MGKIEWCNRKFRLDVEIFNLDLIYKFPFLSKNKFLLNLSIRNIFDVLPDLKFVIKKKQNPLSRFDFFLIDTSDLTTNKNWMKLD
jgi:hypothetical protein